jgi:hypothetical protein
MDDMFVEREATMQERLAGTNPIDGIGMIFLQLLLIDCLTGFLFPLLLECLSPSSFKYSELSTGDRYHSMNCISDNSRG